MVFNYSRLHFFDKNGHELILSHRPNVKIDIHNDNISDFSGEYALVKSTPDSSVELSENSSLLRIKTGSRFNINEGDNINTSVYINDTSNGTVDLYDPQLSGSTYELHEYTSSSGNENYPVMKYNDDASARTVTINNLCLNDKVDFFPTYSFKSNINFEKVSTGLTETQTIFVLVEDEYSVNQNGSLNYVPVSEYVNHYDEFCQSYIMYNEIIERLAFLNRIIQEDENYITELNIELNELTNEYDILESEIRELNEQNEEYKQSHGGTGNPDLEQLISEKSNRRYTLRTEILPQLRNSINGLTIEINNYKEERTNINTLHPDAEAKRAEAQALSQHFIEVKNYIDRFELMFFIDCREQNDFRMFTIKNDELQWSDRKFLNFNTKSEDGSNDNGFSVNIGFNGENDGVYEQSLYVCIVDKDDKETNDIGEAYPIGEIKMLAETEGEDERYRTFFTNFGVPDPKYYDDIFIDSEIGNDTPDFESINKHSKKMFLAYSEIFPYVGSYKALLNAIKVLGYENEIFFKEWYKEVGNDKVEDNGYVTYEISFDGESKINVPSNLDISERIHLRKMNWMSIVYKINEEIDTTTDKWGFPSAVTNYNNFNTDRLVKILSLKNWLEKYAVGVNCHITDVSGEGVVFERYNLPKYGTYQRVLEYDNEKSISVVPTQDTFVIEDGSANIEVEVHTDDKNVMLADIQDKTFLDFCDGYFDSDSVYRQVPDNIEDSSLYVYFGKCMDFNDNVDNVEVRTKVTTSDYRFGSDFLDSSAPDLLLTDDKIIFDPIQCYTKYMNSGFTNLPVIQIEKGVIKKYGDNSETKGEYQEYSSIEPFDDTITNQKKYKINIQKTFDGSITFPKTYILDEIPTFIQPLYSTFTDTTLAENLDSSRGLGYFNVNPYITQYILPDKFSETDAPTQHANTILLIVDEDNNILYQKYQTTSGGLTTEHEETINNIDKYYVVNENGNKVRADLALSIIKNTTSTDDNSRNHTEYNLANQFTDIIPLSNSVLGAPTNWQTSDTYDLYFNTNSAIIRPVYGSFESYALRYNRDNINSIPCFYATGYTEKQMLFENNIIFPHQYHASQEIDTYKYEYIFDIIDGRMIFTDKNNDTVILKFTYSEDTKKGKIYVDKITSNNVSSKHSYKINSLNQYTDTFEYNQTYNEFVDGYKKSVDEYVSFNNTKKINVNNIGEYRINTIRLGESNEMFVNTTNKRVNILPSLTDTFISTNDAISELSEISTYKIPTNVVDCVFEYTPKYQLKNIDKNNDEYIFYGKSNGLEDVFDTLLYNSNQGSVVTFTSMSDRYDYPSSSRTWVKGRTRYFTMITKISGNHAHMGMNDYTSYSQNNISYSKTFENANTNNGSHADATIYIYDTMCEYPVCSFPCILVPSQYDNDICYIAITDSKDTSSDINDSLFQKYVSGDKINPRYTYYIVPTWSIKSKLNSIIATDSSNEINTQCNIDSWFDENYQKSCGYIDSSNNRVERLMTVFSTSDTSLNYFGKGMYQIKNQPYSADTSNNIKFYAYNGKKRPSDVVQENLDASIWIAPSNLDYMKYTFDIDVENSDFDNNTIKIVNNSDYKNQKMYIDQNFAVSLRDFDTDDAIDIWDDSSAMFSHTYRTNITINQSKVKIYPSLRGYSTEHHDSISVRWKVYIKDKYNSRKLLMESFNTVLMLDLGEKYGTYDLEMTIWDQNGNRMDKKIDNCFTYKKGEN